MAGAQLPLQGACAQLGPVKISNKGSVPRVGGEAHRDRRHLGKHARHPELRLIVLPRAVRQALPAYGNEVILMLKGSALASTITLLDLTGAARTLIARTGQGYGCASSKSISPWNSFTRTTRTVTGSPMRKARPWFCPLIRWAVSK